MFTFLVEYFDPSDIKHMRAYEVLLETGDFPTWFVDPHQTVYEEGWRAKIDAKIAVAYLKAMKAEKIEGMPLWHWEK